jgi:putative membrane protein
MRKSILKGLAALALSLSTACSSDDSVKQAVDQSLQQFEAAGVQGMENDALFAAEAASASMMEVQLSQAAAEMAVSPEVKQLAQDIEQANQQMLNELQEIASQNNFVLPSAIGNRHNDIYQEVTSKSGIAFDLAYIDRLARGHHELLERYEDVAQNGKTMDLKQYASKQLPLLSQQQQMIEELQDKIDI